MKLRKISSVLILQRREVSSKNFPIRPPIVSLGLYGDNRTQGGGKLNLIAGEGMKMKTTREDLKKRMNKL
jgi:hypothetical protein